MTTANRVIAALSLVLALAAPARAQLPDLDRIVQVTLLPGWKMDDGRRMGALRVTLAPGWKTYWRTTGGGAGIAPRFDWSGSTNLADARPLWPRPEVLTEAGLQVIGYEDQLILPFAFTAREPGQPMQLKARLEMGVCSEVCIPVDLTVSAEGGNSTDADNFLIRLALDDQITPAARAGVQVVSCKVEPIDGGYRLRSAFRVPDSLRGPDTVVFELPDPDIWTAPATVLRKGDIVEATTEFVTMSGDSFTLDPGQLRMTLIGPDSAVEKQGCTVP